MKHTSFASPLDSILFRDSTHSSHFAQPLGTSGTSIPPFTSRSTDTDVPTSAALASPPPLPFSLSLSLPFLLRSSCFPSLTARTGSASFPARRPFPLSLDPRASFVRSFVVFNPPLRPQPPPAWSRSYIQYCRYVPSFVSRIVNTRLPTRRIRTGARMQTGESCRHLSPGNRGIFFGGRWNCSLSGGNCLNSMEQFLLSKHVVLFFFVFLRGGIIQTF